MPCPVLIAPSCLITQAAVGAAARAGASDVLGGIASAVQSGIAWMITQTVTWWIQVPSPDLAGSPARSSSGSCRWPSRSPSSA